MSSFIDIIAFSLSEVNIYTKPSKDAKIMNADAFMKTEHNRDSSNTLTSHDILWIMSFSKCPRKERNVLSRTGN